MTLYTLKNMSDDESDMKPENDDTTDSKAEADYENKSASSSWKDPRRSLKHIVHRSDKVLDIDNVVEDYNDINDNNSETKINA